MKILGVKNLMKHYGSGENLVKAVDGIDLSVERGEFIAVVGTSGSGKTTLLNLIGGLDTPDSGKIWIEGQIISDLGSDELTVFRRRKIGFVFQNYNLVTAINVYKNIVMPIRLDGNKVDGDHIRHIVSALGIENKLKAYPNQLSGGQQQRVAIARALSAKPSLILADEPTGNLDSRTSQEVMGLLKSASREFDQTVIMITHNEEIAQLADRIIHIEDGKIIGGEA
ncbi:MAG: ABC transporter ATP-binding protein [Eubacterium sp.]|nr:ABC transporter ATP-binding protein [Eubacterium sp.]